MYSWPSTSVIREPVAEAIRNGNGWKSSTDRVEPPGITTAARSNNSIDFGRWAV